MSDPDATTLDDLPRQAKNYLQFLSDACGVPVGLVGVGPGREQFVQFTEPSVGDVGHTNDDEWDGDPDTIGPGVLVI